MSFPPSAYRGAAVTDVGHHYPVIIMNKTNEYRLDACRNARAFVFAHPELNTLTPAFPQRVTALSDATNSLEIAAAEQERLRVAVLDRTSVVAVLIAELRERHMQPIVSIARIIAAADPANAADVRMPARKCSRTTLLNSAAAMLTVVEPRRALFEAEGLPPDFVEQLRSAMDAASAAINARVASRVSRTGTTEELHRLARVAGTALRALDIIIRREVRDPALRREWKAARRISRPARPRIEGGGAENGSVPTPTQAA
jgi:hypothetical protein